MNMFFGTGDATTEDMVRDMKRGLIVTRFWYTRTVHPLNVVVTGMTRDGTFLVEDGRIVGPVRSMRFTQGYLDAMNNVDAIGRDAALLLGDLGGGARRMPALKSRGGTSPASARCSGDAGCEFRVMSSVRPKLLPRPS